MADFSCPEPGCGFQSFGWPTEELAEQRGNLHLEEHESGEAMQELADFMTENEVEV